MFHWLGSVHGERALATAFFFLLQECTLTSWAFFLISCVTCVRIMKFASRPWHTQACVIGDNFPPHCVPGSVRAHTHTHTHTSAAESRGSQCRTRLRHTVPHAAMLFLSHDARQQMAVWRGGENNCGHARRPPAHLITSEPRRDTTRDCARSLELNS